MCGLAGFAEFGESDAAIVRTRITRMVAAMQHRGPDDLQAVAFSSMHGALGASRLSLVDVAHGSQPVSNEDGTVWAVLNGEIYNFRELTAELTAQGHRFRSHSDTEVLVHLYEEHDEEMFTALSGMYALAIFDLHERRILLGRDHAGMKPLYYAERGRGLAFASDARALFAGGVSEPQADWPQLERYFDYGYVPAPGCAFLGLRKLPPGCWLTWKDGRVSTGRHWQPPIDCAGFDPEAPAHLEALLRAATKSHLQGDVEVGCFLSGGWDSSIVAAMAHEHLGSLKTFSLVLPESPEVNEAAHARSVAAALGTDHHEVEYRAAMLPGLIEESVWNLEEPSSCTPSVLAGLLSKLAAKHVKTVVGGEGADELFGGYSWLRPQAVYRLRPVVPAWIPRLLLPFAPDFRWSRALRQIGAPDEDEIHFEYVRRCHPTDVLWPGPERQQTTTGADAFRMVAEQIGEEPVLHAKDRQRRRLLLEFGGRLTGGILFANDRMSMAESLELRTPFLDRRVVEFGLRLPPQWKLHRGQEKRILQPLARKYAPSVASRRKVGLHVPERSMGGPEFRDYSFAVLLDPQSLYPRILAEHMLRQWFDHSPRNLRFLPTLLRLQLWWNAFLAPGSRGRRLAIASDLPMERVAFQEIPEGPAADQRSRAAIVRQS